MKAPKETLNEISTTALSKSFIEDADAFAKLCESLSYEYQKESVESNSFWAMLLTEEISYTDVKEKLLKSYSKLVAMEEDFNKVRPYIEQSMIDLFEEVNNANVEELDIETFAFVFNIYLSWSWYQFLLMENKEPKLIDKMKTYLVKYYDKYSPYVESSTIPGLTDFKDALEVIKEDIASIR